MSKTFTRAEVAKHNTAEDLWCIIDHQVYNLTDFLDAHPGGNIVLEQVAGKDATGDFYNLHRQEVLQKYRGDLCVGVIAGEKPEIIDPQPGDLCPVPYAEPLWLRPEFQNPYYNESHRRFRKALREFVDKDVTPEAQQKEKDGTYISQELIQRMYDVGLMHSRMGPGKHLHGRKILGVIDGKEFDYFHDLIQSQELVRANARGLLPLFSFLLVPSFLFAFAFAFTSTFTFRVQSGVG
jgi:hypothetical protein